MGYFFFAGPNRPWKEMPARIAFCCVDAGVRPRTLAARKAVVVLARTLSFLSSVALQAFPWLEGRRAIEVSRVDGLELTMIHPDMTDCLSERIDKSCACKPPWI